MEQMNERDTRTNVNEFADVEEVAKILTKLSPAARQRILGAVKYAEMVEEPPKAS